MEQYSRIPIIQCSYNLNLHLQKITATFPVNFRHSVGRQLAERSMHTFTTIVLTNFIRQHQQRLTAIEELDKSLFLLTMDIRLAKDLKLISLARHAELNEALMDIKRQLTGWQRWSQNQLETH